MRLTKKQNTKLYPYIYSGIDDTFEGTPINKLGQLEDIEEELGIDLITLFKALKNGICEILQDGEYIKFCGSRLPIKPHKLKVNVKKKCLEKGDDYFYFKDYDKTWTLLTKEELL